MLITIQVIIFFQLAPERAGTEGPARFELPLRRRADLCGNLSGPRRPVPLFHLIQERNVRVRSEAP